MPFSNAPVFSKAYTAVYLAGCDKNHHLLCKSSDRLERAEETILKKEKHKRKCTLLGKLKHSHGFLHVN